MLRSPRRIALPAAMAAICLFCGCAAEGPPHPPRLQTPEQVKDLSVTQVGRALTLTFTTPRLATDGRRLTKPLAVEIFRQVIGPGTQNAGGAARAKPSKPFVSIAPQELAKIERSGKVRYRMNLIEAEYVHSIGERFEFHVVTFTRGFRGHPHASETSNEAILELLNVSQPVENLIARQVPHAIDLQWSAPRASLTGEPLPPIAGYRIYRRLKSQPGEPAVIADSSSASYRDARFDFGAAYVYTVAAVFTRDGFTATSAPSATVEITPRETFPPSPPSGLMAVYTGSSVELIWKPEITPDLAGYNVYRQEQGESARRLNPQLLRTPAFSDRSVQQDAKYTYWVTAVDTAHNESKPSAQASVETR